MPQQFDCSFKAVENQGLEKVIILKRIFRCDTVKNDPSQIKAKMSEFGNRVLEDMWLTRGCPKSIVITGQPLECEGELRISRYGVPTTNDYDGIHMRGKLATQHYTGSMINILLDNLPGLKLASKIPVNVYGPTSYAAVLKNGCPAQQPKFNPSKSKKQFNPAQPQSVRNGWQGAPPGVTRNMVNNPATGTNNTPLGERYFYNVKTQNRFTSSVSGN